MVAVPAESHGNFFVGDAYIILRVSKAGRPTVSSIANLLSKFPVMGWRRNRRNFQVAFAPRQILILLILADGKESYHSLRFLDSTRKVFALVNHRKSSHRPLVVRIPQFDSHCWTNYALAQVYRMVFQLHSWESNCNWNHFTLTMTSFSGASFSVDYKLGPCPTSPGHIIPNSQKMTGIYCSRAECWCDRDCVNPGRGLVLSLYYCSSALGQNSHTFVPHMCPAHVSRVWHPCTNLMPDHLPLHSLFKIEVSQACLTKP